MSAWIRMILDEDADEELLEVLRLARTPNGTVDNVMRVHSLRPGTMKGHVILYRAVLHDDANPLSAWLQEIISSYVSILNNCPYSLANHWANARHLIANVADLLARWTDGACTSTPHRVVNSSGRERLSLVFAFDRDPETVIDARQIYGADHPAQQEATTCGNDLIWRFNKAFFYREKQSYG